jgi:hypothetical protein
MNTKNADRAEFANWALESYREVTNSTAEDMESAISDLLCDIRHLADSEDLCFEGMLSSSYTHYEAEIDEENEA